MRWYNRAARDVVWAIEKVLTRVVMAVLLPLVLPLWTVFELSKGGSPGEAIGRAWRLIWEIGT